MKDNYFCKVPLWQAGKTLSAVAMGHKPAQVVILDATLVNVCTGEIAENTDVAIASGRIALVGDAKHCIGSETQVIHAKGRYIAPGFMDGHIHVESSMIGVGEYAKAVIPHGTTSIYMDPHEICNVLGLPAVECMMNDAQRTPLKAMLTTPSCVPAVPGFEDTGSLVTSRDVAETMTWANVAGLGEMMNFPGIINCDDEPHRIISETLKAGKVVTGHYSIPETGMGLNAYIASGVRCCHESTRAEDALAKMRLGMYAMLREGSAWKDLHQVAKSITHHKVDSRFALLVSDDTHPHTLVTEGHLDHILRRAVAEGIDAVTAIQMVTINCAQCFRMDHELGSITPGKCADIVFFDNLIDFNVSLVLIDGNLVSENGKLCREPAPYVYPDWVKNSIHIKESITPDSFKIKAPDGCSSEALVSVIEVGSGKVANSYKRIVLPLDNGYVNSNVSQDVLKTAVFERHHSTGNVGLGLVKGFGIQCGAMASTVAHDAHNLLVVGTNDRDMALAANTLIACGGGMTAVKNGQVLGTVPLPIAGIMSDKSAEEMSALVERLNDAWQEIGCQMVSPFMTMALIPLACLPEIRLTDRGLVDCTEAPFKFAPLFL